MRSRVWMVSGWLTLTAAAAYSGGPGTAVVSGRAQDGGWTLPASAADERNPLEVTEKVLDEGRKLFRSKCGPCHGTEGGGNGPMAAPPDYVPADLTRSVADPANSEGVLFYKVWNGRRRPDMPAFKTDLTRDEVWQVVAYVQTLGK